MKHYLSCCRYTKYGIHNSADRFTPQQRLSSMVDEGSFKEWGKTFICDTECGSAEYDNALEAAQRETGDIEAIRCGRATIGGIAVAVAIMNPFFLMGSMGTTVGEKIVRTVTRAAKQELPLVILSSSGGARMQEGLMSLMQMARITCAIAKYKETKLPYISIICNPTMGGVSASFATQGDIILIEKGALFGFTGSRIIKQTYCEDIPEGFQSSNFAYDHGQVDLVLDKEEIRNTVGKLLGLHRPKATHFSRESFGSTLFLAHEQPAKAQSGWESVKISRNTRRPTSKFYISGIFESFIELHGDRLFGDDPVVITGIGLYRGLPVTIIAQERGDTTAERIKRNFGCMHPEGYRKATRAMKQAERFGRPVVCFVDTQGAHCGVESEERGQSEAISSCLATMASAKTPIITVFIGEGGSGGALALSLSDSIGILEYAYYAVSSPEAYATILWKDSSRAREAADEMDLTALSAASMGVVDYIIPEPVEGAHVDPQKMLNHVSNFIGYSLDKLMPLSLEHLLRDRHKRFLGSFQDFSYKSPHSVTE